MTELEKNQQIDETLQKEALEQSIGQILTEKRLDSKIEMAEICAYLKVKERDVLAIERDDLQGVTKHIYVLGLIRSYAKFLKIEPQIIEEKIKLLSLKSNVENKEHLLINIGEEPRVSPSKDSFFNFLLISGLLFLVLLSLYNAYENNGDLITNKNLIRERENIDS